MNTATSPAPIAIGARVRSFDFAFGPHGRDLTGERACYVEGTVEQVGVVLEGCPRYAIRVERRVWAGEPAVEPGNTGELVFPPVNGIASTLGGRTNFVEVLP